MSKEISIFRSKALLEGINHQSSFYMSYGIKTNLFSIKGNVLGKKGATENERKREGIRVRVCVCVCV